MRSAIWKLSALATVIGLGLVAVVMQQQGLGVPTGKPGEKAGATTNPPSPKVPAAPGAKAKAAAVANADPFTDPNQENASAPPSQNELGNSESDVPVTLAATNNGENPAQPNELNADPNEEPAAEEGTKPRIKPRALNFKDKLDNDEQEDAAVARSLAATDTGARTGRRADNRSATAGADPADQEGAAPGDQEPNELTDESDPFARRRQALARGTQDRGTQNRVTQNRASRSARDDRGQQSAEMDANPADGPQSSREFGDPNAESEKFSGPIITAPRGGSPHGKLTEDDGGELGNGPAGEAISDSVDASQFEPPEASPAGYRADAGGTGARAKSAAKGRPVFSEDENFKDGPGAKATAPTAPPPVPVAKEPGASKRPQFVPDDDAAEPMTTSPTTPRKSNGMQSIPKIDRNSPDAPEGSMPPPVAKSGRPRPNPFAEDGDGPGGMGGAGGRPANNTSNSSDSNSEIGSSLGADRTQTNPRGPKSDAFDDSFPGSSKAPRSRPGTDATDIERDAPPALTGTPDAAASQSSQTEVLANPQRRTAPMRSMGNGTGTGSVTIEKTAPPTAYVGQPLIYQIYVRNQGYGAAQQVVVEDILPQGVTIQGSIPQAEQTGRKLAWKIGALAAGEERKISVKVIPGSAGAIGSAATVKFIPEQTYASTDTPGASDLLTTTSARTSPRSTTGTSPRNGGAVNGIQLDMQAPPQVRMGQAFEVRFRITNRTGQPLTNLMVRNTLSRNLIHESRFQDLEYRVESLGPGETRDMPLTLTAIQGGRAISRVIAMTGDERVLRSEEFTLDVAGGQAQPGNSLPSNTPSLSLDVVPPPNLVQVGGRVVYEFRLTNRGTVPVRQAAVKLSVPRELRLVDAGPVQYRQDGMDIVFDAIPILDAGQQAILRAEFTAQTAGETFVKVQFVGAHMKRPLSREEGLMIGDR